MNLLDKVFSGKPSRADFAETVIQAPCTKPASETDRSAESDFSLKLAGGRHNFSRQCLRQLLQCPAQRAPVHNLGIRCGGGFSSPDLPSIPSDFATVKPSLMPVIRDAAYSSMIQLMNRKSGKRGSAERRLCSRISPEDWWSASPMTPNATSPRSIAIFLSSGESVLRKLSRPQRIISGRETDPNRFAGRNGVYWGEWADSYDSSRILLTELIYRLSVDGDPVAFVPNRDQLWVTGTNNSAGLAAILKGGMESHFKQGHPLSPDLYVLEDGTWKVYVPEDKSLRELWMKIKEAARRDRLLPAAKASE